METSLLTVVAVVVTRNPGPSFEDTLASLAAQDYPSLPILVLDDGSREPVTNRVAQIVPSAFVRRFDRAVGFAAAANESLAMVQGASYLLFCHDDVALAPDAVRLMVVEAARSGAALVAPKIVAWNAHDRLLSLGSYLDRIGSPIGVVEVLELDQGQHDGVRDVTHAPGAAVLVQAEAFRAAGGFDVGTNDPSLLRLPGELVDLDPLYGPDLGEDIDLSWRMKQLGKTIVVQPMARIAHLGSAHGSSTVKGSTTAVANQVGVAREANRLRTMITTASGIRLPFVLFVLLVRSIAQMVIPGRRVGSAGFAPWRVLFGSIGSVRAQRARVQAARVVSDHDLMVAFQPVGARTRASIRAEVTTEGALAWTVAERVVAGKSRLARSVFAASAVFFAVLVIGSRWLVRHGIPTTGQFAPWPSVRGLFGAAFSEWRASGFGVSAPAPPGTFLLAGLSALFAGHSALAQTVTTLGLLPLGGIGMWRLANHLSADRSAPAADAGPDPAGGAATSPTAAMAALASTPAGTPGVLSANVVATATYLVAPVFYDGLVAGRFDALVAYGLFPWLLHRLIRNRTAVSRSRRMGRFADAVHVGVPLALVVALAPTLLPLVVVLVVGWGLGSLVTGSIEPARVLAGRIALATATAFLLLAPWVSDLVLGTRSHAALITGGDQAAHSGLDALELLRMAAGPVGRNPLSWGFPALALLPLLVADDERFRNAVRAWTVAILAVALLWATGRGWIPVVIPNEHATLVLVALGLSLAMGLGVAGVQRDARSRSFGWRQAFGLTAGAGVLALTVPVALSAGSGRWNLPERTLASELRWLNQEAAEGGYRIAWLGSPKVLPSAAWRVGDDLAISTSDDGLPSVLGMYGARSTGALDLAVGDLRAARDHKTARLGSLLAPYAVRYIVVLDRPWVGGPSSPIPADFRSALLDQLDLRQIEVSSGALLMENTAWVPTYAAVPARPESRNGSVSIDLAGSQPVLLSNRPAAQLADDALVALNDPEQSLRDAEARRNDLVAGTELRGRVPPISTLTVAVAANDRWRATGATFDPSPIRLSTGTMAFAATGVSGSDGAPAIGSESSVDVVSLEYQSPPLRRVVRAGEGVLWAVCLLTLLRTRRHDRRSAELRLLAAERLGQSEDPASEFGASLGWDGGDGDDGELLEAEAPNAGFARSDVVGDSGSVAPTRRSHPEARSGSGAGSPSAATSVVQAKSSPPSDPDDSTGSVEGQLATAVEGEDLFDGGVADALWDTWSRRRGERDERPD